ncbi:MAG TPA: acetylornithine deacetylase [Alphaproteobacteria bacterium]|nr:acetylornithine deacetylase [Alphaproteobacteria bacterium]
MSPHGTPAPVSAASRAWIERLVAFPTVSKESNLGLIEHVRDYLAGLGVAARLVHDESGRKANLYATLGPEGRGGIMLSGHTDVVPVEGQDWTSDPFRVVERAGRLYGRGTSDMKSFIAVLLAAVPGLLRRDLKTPIHLALSYDEEVGCIGVRRLIALLETMEAKPRFCIVGEPTLFQAVRGHKGKLSCRCTVRGLESHSALTHKGVNAVECAAELVAYLARMGRGFRERGPYDDGFDPPYTTVQTGVIHGGTQVNIVPRECRFDFEFRPLPGQDPKDLLAEVQAYAEQALLPGMRAVASEAGVGWDTISEFPGLDTDEEAEVTRLVKRLTGANATGKVSYGTEGGLFARARIPTVVCGPGSIEQAHKADEWVALEQVARCETFIERVGDWAESG